MNKSDQVLPSHFMNPEFYGVSPNELEYCNVTGKIVKKKRWEFALRNIQMAIDPSSKSWEISDVVMAVRVMKFGEIARVICSPIPKPIKIQIGPLTDDDLRLDEFKGACVDDYELNGHGEPARKDRWEYGIREIAHILGIKSPNFEISEVRALFDELRSEKEIPSEDIDDQSE